MLLVLVIRAISPRAVQPAVRRHGYANTPVYASSTAMATPAATPFVNAGYGSSPATTPYATAAATLGYAIVNAATVCRQVTSCVISLIMVTPVTA